MKTERKTVGAQIKQGGEDGTFEAVIATFGMIDHDGDIVERGAFGAHPVPILPAHDAKHVPMGKAIIEERGDLAVAVGRFNLEIPAAQDWNSALKFDLQEVTPAVQEWSWGFRVDGPQGAMQDTVDGRPVRRLLKLDQREISPVLRGASIGTGTLQAKRLKAEGLSDTDVRAQLQAELLEVETNAEHLWVDAVFSDAVVYTMAVEDEASRTLERQYTRAGDGFEISGEATEVVPQVSYQPAKDDGEPTGLKLVDQVRMTQLEVAGTVARLLDAMDARAKRGRNLGEQSKAQAMALAVTVRDMERTLQHLTGMAEGMLPEELAARAAANFLAGNALTLGVDTG